MGDWCLRHRAPRAAPSEAITLGVKRCLIAQRSTTIKEMLRKADAEEARRTNTSETRRHTAEKKKERVKTKGDEQFVERLLADVSNNCATLAPMSSQQVPAKDTGKRKLL